MDHGDLMVTDWNYLYTKQRTCRQRNRIDEVCARPPDRPPNEGEGVAVEIKVSVMSALVTHACLPEKQLAIMSLINK